MRYLNLLFIGIFLPVLGFSQNNSPFFDGNPFECDLTSLSNNFEDGYPSSGPFIVANDITVPAGMDLDLYMLHINAIIGNDGAEINAQTVDIYFYEDEEVGSIHRPGAPFGTAQMGITPEFQSEVGTNFGLQFWEIGVDIDDIILPGDPDNPTTYWIGITINAKNNLSTNMEFQSSQTEGHPIAVYSGGGNFNLHQGKEGVYTFFANCLPMEGATDFPYPYCDVEFTEEVMPITLVEFADLENSSDTELNGSPALEDFTELIANIETGETYNIGLNGYAGEETNYFSVFIDWNQNGNFDDPGEKYEIGSITDSDGTGPALHSGEIFVPGLVPEGETRMRIVMNTGQSLVDPCGEYLSGQAEDYTLSVTTGSSVGADECSWTVHIFSDTSYGDEISWELRQAGFTILSGENYLGAPWGDIQTINAEGPLEFVISAQGTMNDNTADFTISNGNEIVLEGLVEGGDQMSFTDLQCGFNDLTEDQCRIAYTGDQSQGFSSPWLVDNVVAADFHVEADLKMTVENIKLQIINPVLSVSLSFYEDDNGAPGEEIMAPLQLTPTSQRVMGIPDFNALTYEVNLELFQPQTFEGGDTGKNYWMAVKATPLQEQAANVWAYSSEINNGTHFFISFDNYQTWTDAENNFYPYDGAFTLQGNCQDLSLPDYKEADFSFYPNPVESELYLKAETAIQKVELYNLTGQRILVQYPKNTDAEISTKSLQAGVYFLKVFLDQGVQSFKVVKK